MSLSNSLKDTPVCCFENTVNPFEWFGICVRCNCMWLVCTDLKCVEEVQIIFLLLSVDCDGKELPNHPGIIS